MRAIAPAISILMCVAFLKPSITIGQLPSEAQAPKYKLTVVENASISKRVKKGQVSSQAVVKVTDENDVPVAGVAVLFTIPQGAGGASFASGGLTSVVTTNAAGVASSGSLTATAGSSLSVSAAASVPGGVMTTTVPIGTGVAAAAGAGISTGLLIGIIAGVGAAIAGGIAVKVNGGGGNPPPSPQGSIGAAGAPTFGR